MVRQMIRIEEDKCDGCGLCAGACHEGAIEIVEGKAKLLRDDYCDGLGNCLPVCHTGAISFEMREAAAFDEKAVAQKKQVEAMPALFGGCPGSRAQNLKRPSLEVLLPTPAQASQSPSELTQWPVQIKLAPVNAPYFEGARLLVAADCSAFAYGNFHADFIKNHVTLIGCPKLDEGDYAEKLGEILKNNTIKNITVARMEVPCCGGITNAVERALAISGKQIPWRVSTISVNGDLLDDLF